MEQQYKDEYEEIQCVGRGNFGAAYLVRHKQENQKYIAKKVMLSGLKQKEKEAAMLEVNLLKNLDHQHIVTYKQSYFTLEMLIIIMEYCEVGDLSYHIKRKIKNGEFFEETEIFNWFIQICLALEYVHARRVIHRDLKAQNIFLTGNLTVKLGDFGISRVLENSNAAAMTVVGTPYYMSPEACQSQPYTSKSDVWSLGVILYELCTLKHAFVADNLLGLVFKIVQEKHEPVSKNARYSQELSDLIDRLLEKDPMKRPSVREILKMELIRRKAKEFLEQNEVKRSKTIVFKKNMPVVVKAQQTQQPLARGVEGGFVQEEDEYAGLTPAQKIKLKKEREAQRQMEIMKTAASEANKNYDFANQKKLEQLHADSTMPAGMFAQQMETTNPGGQPQNVFGGGGAALNFQNESFNQKTSKSSNAAYFQQLQREKEQQSTQYGGTNLETEFGMMSMTDPSQSQMNRFASPVMQQQQPPPQRPSFGNDDRPIKAKGTYDVPPPNEFDYDIVDDLSEKQAASQDESLMSKVYGGIASMLEKQLSIVHEKNNQQKQEESKDNYSSSFGDSLGKQQQSADVQKQQIKNKLGDRIFDHYYSMIYQHRANPMADETQFRQKLKNQVGSNRDLQNLIFELEQVVFKELQIQLQF